MKSKDNWGQLGQKKPRNRGFASDHYLTFVVFGRGKRIRTSDPCVPNAVLYQAELFPDGQQASIAPMNREF